MNILGSLVRDHPGVIDRLSGDADRVPLEALAETLESVDFPLVLNRDVISALREDDAMGSLLGESYLAVVPREVWEAALEQASPAEVREVDWVVFAASPGSSRGITLPEDRDAGMRVSLFAPSGDSVRRVSIEYTLGMDLPTGVSASTRFGCSLPDWGECQGGECDGDCQRRRSFNDDKGLVCWCPHTS